MTMHTFGGRWTDIKLVRVLRYLEAYIKVMKYQSFQLGYIDAFAGTGYRIHSAQGSDDFDFFPELAKVQIGSAAAALSVVPPFHRYWFIENNRVYFDKLLELKSEVPEKSVAEFLKEDANSAIPRICTSIDWKNTRAVAFLDPYGMQVKWKTIEAIAETKAIDMWWLFPSHMGVGRMLPKDGDIPDDWKRTLDEALGTNQWQPAFYEAIEETQGNFFDSTPNRLERTFTATSIERFLIRRLSEIFPGVAPRPVHILINNRPAYQLYFAMANPSKNAREHALRIANWLIENEPRLVD
ncbi:MAG: three-Cys-motif partner protein TcmP [Rhodospirillaceae bacterium]|nr:three-Cys-motif partner protein TcmP [Rhodospirillaceae bacterium]